MIEALIFSIMIIDYLSNENYDSPFIRGIISIIIVVKMINLLNIFRGFERIGFTIRILV